MRTIIRIAIRISLIKLLGGKNMAFFKRKTSMRPNALVNVKDVYVEDNRI